MAFDAGMLRAVVQELNQALYDGKVEKIGQPAKEEIHMMLRHFGENHRLCIQVGSQRPRISLTARGRENPPVPPLFCTLLRKHLGGAKLLSVTQEGYERVARITFRGSDEMGYPTTRHLIAEIMGKYSNLILTDESDHILAVLRPVDFTTSTKRQLLPGMTYELPPKQDKISPLDETCEGFLSRIGGANPDILIDKYILQTYLGTSSQVAREIAYLAAGHLDATLAEVEPTALWAVFEGWFDRVKRHEVTPTLIVDAEGAPLDYTYAPLTYFGTAASVRTFDTFSDLLDACFESREKSERIKQRASDLWGILHRAMARISRKMEAQMGELADAEQGETYQRMADLITANIWQLKRGDDHLTTLDYYADPPVEVTVPLDPRLTPAANAQRYYKYYTKAKHAKEYLAREMEKSREELAYLASVEVFLANAQSEHDLNEIREELHRAGYASRMRGYAPPKQQKARPMEYTAPVGGWRILVGRNNLQNDLLTFRTAGKHDLWFHAKGVSGSHVILLCDGAEPEAEDYTYAATLAAIYSAAEGDMVPVDYTRVRYVKKPPSSRPGYVTYSTNYTAYVKADRSILKE